MQIEVKLSDGVEIKFQTSEPCAAEHVADKISLILRKMLLELEGQRLHRAQRADEAQE